MADPAVFDRLTVLSEPIRVRILRVLGREELAVGEIARVLQTSQPTVSRHLKLLDAGGWVLRRRVGTSAWYRMDAAALGAEMAALWALVAAETEPDDTTSIYAEDLRRLEGVVAERTSDSEELFRRLGGRWDGVRSELFGEGFVAWLFAAMVGPGTRADLGCGTGALLPALATAGRAIGVDREEAMLEVARERTAGLPNVEVRRGLLDALPLQDGEVDVAVCALVLHHVEALGLVAREVRRVLRPGGRWIVVDMVEHDREEFATTMGHRHLGFSEAGIRALVEGAGLTLCAFRVLPPDPAATGPGLFVAVAG